MIRLVVAARWTDRNHICVYRRARQRSFHVLLLISWGGTDWSARRDGSVERYTTPEQTETDATCS